MQFLLLANAIHRYAETASPSSRIDFAQAIQEEMTARADSLNKVKGETNKKSGEEFLAKNANGGTFDAPSIKR